MTACAIVLSGGILARAADEAETPDPHMGDYAGTLTIEGGEPREVAWQLIPAGGGRYRINVLPGFEVRADPLFRLQGFVRDDQAGFLTDIPYDADSVAGLADGGIVFAASRWLATRNDSGTLSGKFDGREKGAFTMKRVRRVSPDLGKAPPAGDSAEVLFDGRGLEAWCPVGRPDDPAPWEIVDGVMQVKGGDIMTRETFGDHELHIEFRTPYMPHAGGQGRGNSGVYLQGRYELQVLDSYGLEGADNECGGIYQIARPKVNMCAPPLQWQSYDIRFTAARFDEQGNKRANARVTIVHNGVVIHEDLELPGPTGGAIDGDESRPGPLKLQDHGNPVQFRNIWIVRKDG